MYEKLTNLRYFDGLNCISKKFKYFRHMKHAYGTQKVSNFYSVYFFTLRIAVILFGRCNLSSISKASYNFVKPVCGLLPIIIIKKSVLNLQWKLCSSFKRNNKAVLSLYVCMNHNTLITIPLISIVQ